MCQPQVAIGYAHASTLGNYDHAAGMPLGILSCQQTMRALLDLEDQGAPCLDDDTSKAAT